MAAEASSSGEIFVLQILRAFLVAHAVFRIIELGFIETLDHEKVKVGEFYGLDWGIDLDLEVR